MPPRKQSFDGSFAHRCAGRTCLRIEDLLRVDIYRRDLVPGGC